MNFRVLVVDEDADLCKLIAYTLGSEGIQTLEMHDRQDAINLAVQEHFDLIILDISPDGFTSVSKMRSLGVITPIFALSWRSSYSDMVLTLALGADDYITKPLVPAYLLAKVNAYIRRTRLAFQGTDSTIELGPFRYLCDDMRLYKNGTDIPLSAKESLIMRYLMRNHGKILTREQIYQNVWGDNAVDDNTIMVHIRRLRTKIEDTPHAPVYLRTVRGMGYQFRVG